MTFQVVREGRTVEPQLEGLRTLAEILTKNEYERVRIGTLVGPTSSGGLMSLDAPFSQGQVGSLLPPRPERNLAGFGLASHCHARSYPTPQLFRRVRARRAS